LKIEFQGSRATSDGGLILVLTQEENLAGLAAIHRELRAKSEAIASPHCVVLDMGQHRFRRHGAADCGAASADRIGRAGGSLVLQVLEDTGLARSRVA
jgi:hypothetical protein